MGKANWPMCEACMIMPLVVPMCCGLFAWTGVAEKIAPGIRPPSVEKARTQPNRRASGAPGARMPSVVAPMAAAPADMTIQRGTPRLSSTPASRTPGILATTKAAVSHEAALWLAPRSSTAKVGSQVISEVHWPT
jgi:hypothetical protein